MTDTLEAIEKKIKEVFEELRESKPNASFVYSYVFATSKDPKKAEVKGRLNMAGSKEEVETHMAGLQDMIEKETEKGKKKKGKFYGSK